jgi:diguanylate cyclase (GGDEF)-like protein
MRENLVNDSGLGVRRKDGIEQDSQTFSNLLQEKIADVEKRDWELWIIALGVLGILLAGFLFIVWPAIFLGQEVIYIQASISSQLAVGLFILVIFLGIYLVNKQMQIRKQRFGSILDAWNSSVSHAQLLIDPLTKVFNRSAIEEILGWEIKRVERRQSRMVFLFIDVDNFKVANTRYGHLSGDYLLVEVGAILKQSARGSDYVIRIGGDEFLVALVDTDIVGAESVKSRINHKVAVWNQNTTLAGFRLALSIGVQEYTPTKSLEEIMAEADSKMYAEKNKSLASARQR